MNMDWKSPQTYAIIGGIVISALMAFGVLVTDEATQATSAVAQIAGGVLGIVNVVALVRARRKAS